MAYDEALALRLRQILNDIPGLQEKKMFGGVGFILHGNMACGVNGNDLIVRVGPNAYPAALAHPHTRPFDMTGRPMTGWIMVAPQAIVTQADLRAWAMQGVDFTRTLPPK